jgi:hypothetical protein
VNAVEASVHVKPCWLTAASWLQQHKSAHGVLAYDPFALTYNKPLLPGVASSTAHTSELRKYPALAPAPRTLLLVPACTTPSYRPIPPGHLDGLKPCLEKKGYMDGSDKNPCNFWAAGGGPEVGELSDLS